MEVVEKILHKFYLFVRFCFIDTKNICKFAIGFLICIIMII